MEGDAIFKPNNLFCFKTMPYEGNELYIKNVKKGLDFFGTMLYYR